jgi:hypothetical protein
VTTINPEADPTFLAYQRQRQFGEDSLREDVGRQQTRLTTDYGLSDYGFGRERTLGRRGIENDSLDRGFHSSGQMYRDLAELEGDVGHRQQKVGLQYDRGMQDLDTSLVRGLATYKFGEEEAALDARRRLMTDLASSGYLRY